MDESRSRYEATVDAVQRLLTEESVDEGTPYFSFRNATSLPHVVQRPHPPKWGAAVKSPESFQWLAEKGFGVMLALAPAKQHVHSAATWSVGYEAMGRQNAQDMQRFDVRRQGTAVIGSPESVVEQIHELRETYGVDTFLWNVDFGGAGYSQMASSLRVFVDKVLPKL